MKSKILASILSIAKNLNEEKVKKDLQTVLKHVNGLHFDVIDGKFAGVDNTRTMNAMLLKKLKAKIKSVHIMCQSPSSYFDDFIKAGANEIAFHVEASEHPEEDLIYLKSRKLKAGIAIKLETKLEEINANVLKEADFFIVMAIITGFPRQKLNAKALQKIKVLRKMFPEKEIILDGGVKAENLLKVKKAGATAAVIGSGIFDGNVQENLMKIEKELKR